MEKENRKTAVARPVKNSSIEMLRLLATLGVVFDHIGVCWIHYFDAEASMTDKIVYYSLVACCHWPVPVFMAITGALLLSKKEMTYAMVWKYFKRIALLVFVFGTAFACMELYFNTRTLGLDLLGQAVLNMLTGNSWKHLWYLYMLLGVYLLLPMIFVCKKVLPPPISGDTVVFLIVYVCFASLLPFLGIERTFIQFPLLSIYPFYLIMGYVLTRNEIQLRVCAVMTDRMAVSVCGITFIAVIAAVVSVYGYGLGKTLHSYTSPLIVMQSLLIFYLFVKRNGCFDCFCALPLIRRFNRCSLGIYIVHMVWINIFIKLFHINLMDYGWGAILAGGVTVFLLSWLSTEVLLLLPGARKYL